MNRITEFDRLVQISPYPVEIEPMPSFYSGGFWYGDGRGHEPYEQKDFHPHIGISPLIKSQSEKIATLVHEIGHAIHYQRHCRCYTTNRELCEYHAERFALRFMLRYKLKGALRFEISFLKRNRHKLSEQWQNLIEQLQSEKIWQRCIEYLQ